MGNSNLHIWLQASRPLTLTAAIIPVVIGVALANAVTSSIRWPLFWLALLGAIFIQIGTNLVNDAKDFERGADTPDRPGPQRVTQAGLLSASSVMRGAWISFALATLCGIPLVIAGGLPIVIIGIASIIAAWAYTGGPWPLGYNGFGEIFVILFFGLVAVGGTYYLQTGAWSAGAFVAGLGIGCLSSVLLAVNNLRDETGDRLIGKKTLVVRFGRAFGIFEIAALSFLPFGLGVYWWMSDRSPAALLPLLSVPLAVIIAKRASRESGIALNKVLKLAAALHASYGLLLSLGLWMSAP